MSTPIAQRGIRGSAAALVAVGALAVAAGPAAAAACSTEQITDTTGGSTGGASVNADGTRVAFTSTGDLTGSNPDLSQELFLFDATTDVTTQITNDTLGTTQDPDINADGTRIAFASNRNIGGGNADANIEIYLHDTDGPTTTQITNTTGGSTLANGLPSIDAAGNRIAFVSSRDVIPTGNADLNFEVYLHDITGPNTTQITTTTGGAFNANLFPEISATGTRIAFVSTRDIGGANADLNGEIFLHNTTSSTTTPLTTTTGAGNNNPSIDGDGTTVSFTSTDDFDGSNPDNSNEIWRVETAGLSTGAVTVSSGGNQDSSRLDGDGGRVLWIAARDYTGQNPDLNSEVFLHDTTGAVKTQVTNSTGGFNDEPAISASGNHLAFRSNRNLTGDNPDGSSEIFLATCGSATPSFTDVPTSNFFFHQIEWMAAAEVASGFPNGTFLPEDGVKRQQMANFLYNLAGQPPFMPPGSPTFSDVPVSNPFSTQIEWMADEGIASGFPNGTFRPGDIVKRQQMANFLYNLAGQPFFTPPGVPSFSDVPVSNSFFDQIEWMVDEGIASGFPNGTFRPQDRVKRQQMANFLLNLVNGPGVDLG